MLRTRLIFLVHVGIDHTYLDYKIILIIYLHHDTNYENTSCQRHVLQSYYNKLYVIE